MAVDIAQATLRNAATAKMLQEWGIGGFVDYWLRPSAKSLGASGDGHNAADWGWTVTSPDTKADGDGTGNFGASASLGTAPANFTCSGASHLIQSPAVFGHYLDFWQAANRLAASQPTGGNNISLPGHMVMDMWAAFTTASANETTTGFGMAIGTSSPITAANQAAFFSSDGTNFRMGSAGVLQVGVGPAVDNVPHRFTIDFNRVSGFYNWFVDGKQYGTNNAAIPTAAWSASWAMCTKAANTNVIAVYGGHIYYA